VIYLPQVILNLLNYCFKLTISRFHIRIGMSWIIVSINFVTNHLTDTCFVVVAIWMGLNVPFTELIIGFVLHVNTGTIFDTVWLLWKRIPLCNALHGLRTAVIGGVF
jgi:hypothetical protein